MYSLLISMVTLAFGGLSPMVLVSTFANQTDDALSATDQNVVSAQDQYVLALQTEVEDLELQPLLLPTIIAALPIVAPEPIVASPVTEPTAVITESTGPSIFVLAPVAVAKPKPAIVTPKPTPVSVAPRAAVSAKPLVTPIPAIAATPPVVAPPVVARPVVSPTATAAPAARPQVAPATPRSSGPILAAMNSQNLGTYYFSAPKLGLMNIPVNPTDASTEAGFRNLQGLGQILYPPGTTNHKSVLFGHSSNFNWVQSQYNEVFRYLNKLDLGDEISIDIQGQRLRYRVTKEEIVGADTGSIITDYGREELVLFTCWPYLTARQRYIIYLDRIF